VGGKKSGDKQATILVQRQKKYNKEHIASSAIIHQI